MEKIAGKSNNINMNNQKGATPVNTAPANQGNNESLSFSNPQAQSSSRLNALDSTILENNAYRDIQDEQFKTEYRIDKIEEELSIIEKELEASKSLNDTSKIDMLTLKKHHLETELALLYKSYKSSNLSGKITNTILKPRMNFLGNIVTKTGNFVSKNILSKISNKFNAGQNLKNALNKLENINKNVNELVSLQAPYGEVEEKYEQLTQYITKANTIQYQISKELSKDSSKIKKNPFAEMTSKDKALAKAKKILQLNKKQDMAKKNALNLNNNLK